jgi:hypothetical protein
VREGSRRGAGSGLAHHQGGTRVLDRYIPYVSRSFRLRSAANDKSFANQDRPISAVSSWLSSGRSPLSSLLSKRLVASLSLASLSIVLSLIPFVFLQISNAVSATIGGIRTLIQTEVRSANTVIQTAFKGINAVSSVVVSALSIPDPSHSFSQLR